MLLVSDAVASGWHPPFWQALPGKFCRAPYVWCLKVFDTVDVSWLLALLPIWYPVIRDWNKMSD